MSQSRSEEQLTPKQVWGEAAKLVPGADVFFEYKLSSHTRWKQATGKVLSAVDLGKADAARYASVKILDGEYQGRAIMFPQDGKCGTVKVCYRVIAVEEPVEFTPSKDNAQPKARQVDAHRAPSPEAEMPPYLRALRGDNARQEDIVGRPTFANPLTIAKVLNPEEWGQVLRTELDVFRAQTMLEKHYPIADMTKDPGDQYVLQDIMRAVGSMMELACTLPTVSTVPSFRAAAEGLIGHLYMASQKKDLNAKGMKLLGQGFLETQNPPFLQRALQVTSELYRVNAYAASAPPAKN
jgi:hypothetical protein